VTFEIWNSIFKKIGNRLHAHGNRLLLCKTVIKLFWASGNRLLPYGNWLPESKNSGKRFFFEKFFWTSCAIQSFLWKKSFYTYLDVFLEVLVYLESSLESSLESWFLIEWLFGIIKISLEALLPQTRP